MQRPLPSTTPSITPTQLLTDDECHPTVISIPFVNHQIDDRCTSPSGDEPENDSRFDDDLQPMITSTTNKPLSKGARRLSMLMQRPVQNEKFSDIQLKPVVRKPAQPQHAEQRESALLKVVETKLCEKSSACLLFYFFYFVFVRSSSIAYLTYFISLSLSHCFQYVPVRAISSAFSTFVSLCVSILYLYLCVRMIYHCFCWIFSKIKYD